MAMSAAINDVKDRQLSKIESTNATVTVSRLEQTYKFAMMLKCSYIYLEAAVAFVNSSPVITNTESKKRLSSALFSEWIAHLVTINGSFVYVVTVITMDRQVDGRRPELVPQNGHAHEIDQDYESRGGVAHERRQERDHEPDP